MKLKFPKISKDTKQTVLGGVVGSLAVNLESAMSWFVAGYPQILKDRLNPNLPRNGALIATLAPPAVAYVMTRKGRTSARADNMKNGILFYDIPKLIDEIAYNVGYQAGLPSSRMATVAMRTVSAQPKRPVMTNGVAATPMSYPQTAVRGKYALKNNVPRNASVVMGRYR